MDAFNRVVFLYWIHNDMPETFDYQGRTWTREEILRGELSETTAQERLTPQDCERIEKVIGHDAYVTNVAPGSNGQDIPLGVAIDGLASVYDVKRESIFTA